MRLRLLVFLLLCGSVVAPTHGSEAEIGSASSDMQEFPSRHSSRQVRIPSALVEKIEKDYRSFREAYGISREAPVHREFLNSQVELTQEARAALRENARIVTPVGGGVIDLEDFVTPLKGAFRAKMVFEKENKEPLENMRLYYISRAQSRQVEGESFGAGCGNYFDLTSFYKSKLSGKGLQVFSAEQRYLSVLAGTYLMVSFAKEALFVGSVTFEDSRFASLQCGSSAE